MTYIHHIQPHISLKYCHGDITQLDIYEAPQPLFSLYFVLILPPSQSCFHINIKHIQLFTHIYINTQIPKVKMISVVLQCISYNINFLLH